MRIFRSISKLSKPNGRTRISEHALAYIRTRSRLDVFTLVMNEFNKSGISQAELAARLGKGTDRVCKLLGAPGNWTLDTVSELLFAINGGVAVYAVAYPLDSARHMEWPEKTVITDKRATYVPRQPAYAL